VNPVVPVLLFLALAGSGHSEEEVMRLLKRHLGILLRERFPDEVDNGLAEELLDLGIRVSEMEEKIEASKPGFVARLFGYSKTERQEILNQGSRFSNTSITPPASPRSFLWLAGPRKHRGSRTHSAAAPSSTCTGGFA